MSQTTTCHYEINQSFNAITRYLHSLRYRNLLGVFRRFHRTVSRKPIRVLDIGAGTAKSFALLDDRFEIEYCGIDRHEQLTACARQRYGDRPNFRMITASALEVDLAGQAKQPDVVLALETLEHVFADEVPELVARIAGLTPRLFVCSVPVEVGPIVWIKNVGSALMRYNRHRNYTWPQTFWAGLGRIDKLPPRLADHMGFDWRWLVAILQRNVRVRQIRRFPLRWLPAGLSTSLFMVCDSLEPSSVATPARSAA